MSRSSTVLRAAAVALLAATATSACSWAQSDFAKKASDAGSTFAAAETTLRLRHEARLTLAYTKGAFVNYKDALEGVEEELPKLPGAPPSPSVEELVSAVHAAQPALDEPCLDNECDWRSQLDSLKHAKDAFAAAAEQ